ncbi:hypothetical protein GK047_28140 [Paenibacillus sp. SYP-B3998]|uniref:Uncharacterized protein n=1 Tax=Paenibacillus sp. SYP-B3998 TaxID=2678564 RepID=A0A6G4A772_9BACL|nr:hypothetical protein [Paenibacillus sp. SYP-B3998]NEW09794.1 hypothetical protein [Paenibacillus sp. SYP-B3998]
MNVHLIRKASVYVAGQAFRKARRNERGEMELRVNRGFRAGSYLALLLGISVLLMQLFMEANAEDAALLWLVGLLSTTLFAFLSVTLTFMKVVVSEQLLYTHRWYGVKMMKLSEITEVGYSRFFGGRFILKSAEKRVYVPVDLVGTVELIEQLQEQLGQELCAQAEVFLQQRKLQLMGLGWKST